MTTRPLAPLLAICLAGSAASTGSPAAGAGQDPAADATWVTTPDGVRLWAVSRGEGEPAILVPNAIFLEEDFAWLAGHRRVVFYDLRNRGRSETVTDPDRLSGGVRLDVADAEAVREHFALDRVALLGHSYLGAMVVLYARKHPERVERILQIGPIGPDPSESFAAQAAQVREDPAAAELARELAAWRERATAGNGAASDLCREYWRVMGRILTGDPAHAEKVFREPYCELDNEAPLHVESHFATNVLPTLLPLHLEPADLEVVQAPTLVIHGTADRAAHHDGGRAWAARLPEARLLTVEGAGHLPWLESPERVRAAVEAFLGGAWPEEATVVTRSR